MMAQDPYRSAWHFRQMRRAMAWTGVVAAPLAALSILVPAIGPFAGNAFLVVVAVGGVIIGYHALQR